MGKKRWLTIGALCYGLYLLAWLLLNAFFYLYDKSREPAVLPLAGAELVELEEEEAGVYRTLGPDGQLRFEGLDFSGRRVVLHGGFESYHGELDIYYQKAGQEEYSLRRRVFARPLKEGGYEYLLPPGRYTALRLDAGTEPGNRLFIEEITLNEPRAAAAYFCPTFRGLMGFLILPALASCCICTIIEWIRYGGSKRRRGAGKEENANA